MKKLYFLLILAAGFLILAGCGKQEEEEAGYYISYINKDTTKLIEQGYEPQGETRKQLVGEFLTMLQTDPQEVEYRNPIGNEIVVNSYTLEEEQLNIDFGEGYSVMDSVTEVLCRAAIVRTMTQIEGVVYVSFFIDGTPLTDSRGNVIGVMTKDSFIENPGEQINTIEEFTIRLYFANKEGNGLVERTMDVYETSNASMEKRVMEQLLEEPPDDGCQSALPKETSLVSVSVLDGVCFVNLSEGFLQQNYEIDEEIVIYSIVNSLTELSTVNRVQISVNGDTSVVYREKCSLETYYGRNLDFVVKENGDGSTEGEGSSN